MSTTLKEYLGQNNTNINESLKSVIMSIAHGAIIVQKQCTHDCNLQVIRPFVRTPSGHARGNELAMPTT